MSAILLAGILLAGFALRTARFGWRTISVEATPLPVAAIALLALAALVIFLNAQMPPLSLDELAYHLTVPKTWVLEGRALELPLLSHSYFPLGIESADLPFLAILGNDGGIASHLLHALGAFAMVAIVFGWASRRASVRTVLLVVLAIATTPALLVTGGWSAERLGSRGGLRGVVRRASRTPREARREPRQRRSHRAQPRRRGF